MKEIIEIIAVPDGNEPEEIRQAWMGVRFTIDEKIVEEIGEIQARNPQNTQEYWIEADVGIKILAEKSPVAAEWWREQLGDDVDDAIFPFRTDLCRLIPDEEKYPGHLKQQLQPILSQIRTIPLKDDMSDEESDFVWKQRYQIVVDWFRAHPENLAQDVADMTYLCTLPNSERYLLTHPVMGNWFLDKLSQFQPQTPHQEKVMGLLKELVAEARFNNHHTDFLYDQKEQYEHRLDQLTSLMLASPEESLPIHQLLQGISHDVDTVIHGRYSREKGRYDGSGLKDIKRKDLTTDLGHGLSSPAGHFSFITWYFDKIVEKNQKVPFDLNIMIVDDQNPKLWYERMTSVGFKDEPGQQGFFFDCESALEALQTGHYDVILTDIELGDGKMNGIEFAKRAHSIQNARGIKPIISVFSYSDEKLAEAEKHLRIWGQEIAFGQVQYNLKSGFSASNFRHNVGSHNTYHQS